MGGKKFRYGFIGVGHMASAVADGFINGCAARADEIMMFDIDARRVDRFEEMGARRATDASEVAESCRYVILAVQPYQMGGCLRGIKDAAFGDDTVIVSIAAAVPTDFVTDALGRDIGVIRLMPNMPMLIGKGAVAASRNALVDDGAFESFVSDLGKTAVVSVMDEAKMNAVIAVNGSAPAYVYLFVKAMLDGAESMGIPREAAEPLILATIEGAVGVIRQKGEPIEALIKAICSPGGTTTAAMTSLEASDFVDAIGNAMRACTARADELTAAL